MLNDLDVAPATTAVLHGMMATLSEVLGGIDGRMAAIEQQLRETRADTGSPRALAQAVEAAVARLSERIEALEAVAVRPPARDDSLHAAIEALRHSIDALAVRPVRDDALHEAIAALAGRPPQFDEELRAFVADVAARPPALDTELRAVVAELAARPPHVDTELRAAVAELAARPPAVDTELRAAVAELAARPPHVDTELRAAVAELAARPPLIDQELRAAVAELAARPPAVDQELRAAVAELAARPPAIDDELRAAIADLASRPPAVDEELRAAVANLAARADAVHADVAALAARPLPAPDEELRAAVADLAARPAPGPDEELRAAVAQLTEIVTRPKQADPEDPVRLGITSLHERLSVLLELAAQPPKPDDAVRAGLVALQQQVEALRDPSPDPAINDLGERLRRLEERTAAAATADEEASNALRLALTRLSEIATAIENLPEPPPPAEFPDFPEFPDIEPVAGLREAMDRVEQQVAGLVAQPGPGPAMAMVAAGLAERFESRTDALVDLLTSSANRLDAVATAPHDVAARVEDFVGRQFAELPALLAHLKGDEVLDRIRTVVESQQGDVVAMRDAMRSLFDSVERHGAVSSQVAELLLENRAALGREIDRLQDVVSGQGTDLGERVQAALEAAARADAHAAEMGAAVADRINDAAARLVADVQAMVATGQDPARLDAVADRISESVRKESELLTQRVASLSVAVDNLRSTIDAVAEDMSNSIGRKATEVGRRLAADFGIKPKKAGEKGSKDRSLGPGGK